MDIKLLEDNKQYIISIMVCGDQWLIEGINKNYIKPADDDFSWNAMTPESVKVQVSKKYLSEAINEFIEKINV